MTQHSCEGQRIYLSLKVLLDPNLHFCKLPLNLGGHKVPQNQSLSAVCPTDYVYSEFNIRAVLFCSYVHPGTCVCFLTNKNLFTYLSYSVRLLQLHYQSGKASRHKGWENDGECCMSAVHGEL